MTVQHLTEDEMVAKIERFGFDKPPTADDDLSIFEVTRAALAAVAKNRLDMYAEGYGNLRDYKSAVKELEDFLASHPEESRS